MSIAHHPDEALLTFYAAGRLELGYQVAIATHLKSCARCRATVRLMTGLGGAMLEDLPQAKMSDGAFAALSAKLDMPEAAPRAPQKQPERISESGLPDFVRRYGAKDWRRIAPGLAMRPILLPEQSSARVFLLKSAPGMTLSHHSHAGTELTCVLRGGFTHKGGHFGPGDFDLGDSSVHHQPLIDAGEPCLCLVAMEGKLKLKGWLALLSPFLPL